MAETQEESGVESLSPAMAKARQLGEMLDERIRSFQKRRERNRRVAWRLRVSIASLGALTTVLVGLPIGRDAGLAVYVKGAALIASALVTVFATWEAFSDNRGLWIKYTKARAQLHAVKAELDYILAGSGSNPEVAKVDELFVRYSAILDEVNASWLQGRLGSPVSRGGTQASSGGI